MYSGAKEGIDWILSRLVFSCIFVFFSNQFKFEKDSGAFGERRVSLFLVIGRDYRSAKSAAVEHTAGDTAGQGHFEDSANV